MRIVALALLVACSGDDDKEPTGTGDTSAPPGGTSDTGGGGPPPDTCVPGDPDTFSGRVLDPGGAGLGDWQLKLCNVYGCLFDTSAADGAFCYENLGTEPYSFAPVPEIAGYPHANVPLTFTPGSSRTLDLVIPPLDPAVTLPAMATELELGAGLFVTVGAADLEPPDDFQDPATEAAGVRVDPGIWPPFDTITGTVLAVWYLEPFDHVAPNGLPVRIGETLGLAEGATVRIYSGSYSDYGWVDAGTLTVTGSELVGSAELPRVTTVIAVQE